MRPGGTWLLWLLCWVFISSLSYHSFGIYSGLACVVLSLSYPVSTHTSWLTFPLILQTKKWRFLWGWVICRQPHNVEKQDLDVASSAGKFALSVFPPSFPSSCWEGGSFGLFHLVQSTGPADLLGFQSFSEVGGRMWWWGICPRQLPQESKNIQPATYGRDFKIDIHKAKVHTSQKHI